MKSYIPHIVAVVLAICLIAALTYISTITHVTVQCHGTISMNEDGEHQLMTINLPGSALGDLDAPKPAHKPPVTR